MVWLGAPDQGASQGPVRPVGFERKRDQPNILPLDLNFTFNFILSSLFVSSNIDTYSMFHRHNLIADRIIQLQHTLCSETNSVPFGPIQKS